MPEQMWQRPWLADRFEGDPGKLALLIPGNGYSAERPLLHFAKAVFMKHGWSVQEVWWPQQPPQDSSDGRASQRLWVDQQVTSYLDRETAEQAVLVGKSLGTLAAKTAADRDLPAIWLTPLLNLDRCVSDLQRARKNFLLIGGTDDPSWHPRTARSFGNPVYEAENADHGMETDDDPANSAEILKQVTIAIDEFVSTL